MSVPKCKECEFHKYESQGASAGKLRHGCKHKDCCISYWISKPMLASEAKISPKWCPKRI